MPTEEIATPQLQVITRNMENETIENNETITTVVVNYFGRLIKSILTDNTFFSIHSPQSRSKDLNKEELSICCTILGTTACTLCGCYLDHSCSVITGQAILGSILGNESSRLYQNFLLAEMKKQGIFPKNNTDIINPDDEIITQQPMSINMTTESAPPSYQSLVDSGAITPGKVTFRGTNSSP